MEALQHALKDKSSGVRAFAAESIFLLGEQETALDVLIEDLRQGSIAVMQAQSGWVAVQDVDLRQSYIAAMQAANVLAALGQIEQIKAKTKLNDGINRLLNQMKP